MNMTISNMKYTIQYMRNKVQEFRKLDCVYSMQNKQNSLNITHLK